MLHSYWMPRGIRSIVWSIYGRCFEWSAELLWLVSIPSSSRQGIPLVHCWQNVDSFLQSFWQTEKNQQFLVFNFQSIGMAFIWLWLATKTLLPAEEVLCSLSEYQRIWEVIYEVTRSDSIYYPNSSVSSLIRRWLTPEGHQSNKLTQIVFSKKTWRYLPNNADVLGLGIPMW